MTLRRHHHLHAETAGALRALERHPAMKVSSAAGCDDLRRTAAHRRLRLHAARTSKIVSSAKLYQAQNCIKRKIASIAKSYQAQNCIKRKNYIKRKIVSSPKLYQAKNRIKCVPKLTLLLVMSEYVPSIWVFWCTCLVTWPMPCVSRLSLSCTFTGWPITKCTSFLLLCPYTGSAHSEPRHTKCSACVCQFCTT